MPESGASPSSDPRMWVITPEADRGFGTRTREIWRYRRILWFFWVKAFHSLTAKTRLGSWWLLIRTLGPLAVASFVFGSVMNVPSGGVPYFVFFMVGQVPWNCFDGPLIRGSRGLEVNRQLLTKLYIPRIILPLGQMAAGVIEPAILTVVLLCALAYYRVIDGVWYAEATPRLAASAGAVLLVLALGFSLTLWTSVWQARARDARFVLRYVVGFWLYFTPVIYPLSMVPEGIRPLMYLNPVTAPVETFRWGMLAGFDHSWAWFGYSVAVTVVTFLGGVWYFTRSESATVDRI